MENKHQSLIFDLLFIFAGCLHVEALSTTEFYPFGSSTIDRKLRPNDDDSSGRIAISVPFPFFSDKYNSLFVSMKS